MNNKCIIFIVRHTQTIGNIQNRLTGRHDYIITLKGKKYINFLNEELKNIKFDAIYSSTSKRAIKTVKKLSQINKKKIIEDDNLREMDFGIYDGWKWKKVNKINPKIKEFQIEENEICGIPNQETTKEVADRMYEEIEKIANLNIGKIVLISSHGVSIEAFLRKVANVPFNKQREKFCQQNTAINEVEYENGSFKILRLADMNHININK